jgi:hypothetical protein
MSLLVYMAAGDRFLSAAQRSDKLCRPPFRVAFALPIHER